MKRTIAWFATIAAVLWLALAMLWMVPNLWGYGTMMGGYGMMGGNYGFMNPLGWLGMALMWLIPAAILTALIAGVVALFNNLTRQPNHSLQADPPTNNRACQNCGKPAQSDWNACPYCGQSLA